MATKERSIELKRIETHVAEIHVVGDGDLVLNKMNARNARTLIGKQTDKSLTRQVPNRWEDIITAVHWYEPLRAADGTEITDTYEQCNEELYKYLISGGNKPCVTDFGLKKSFCQTVVRNEIDKYSTKFENALNLCDTRGLVPVTYEEAWIDDRLMSPQKGSPVYTLLSHFSGWKASFKIAYTENVYSLDQILNIISLAGFGIGIGSGRSSGFGRYHIDGVELLGNASTDTSASTDAA